MKQRAVDISCQISHKGLLVKRRRLKNNGDARQAVTTEKALIAGMLKDLF